MSAANWRDDEILRTEDGATPSILVDRRSTLVDLVVFEVDGDRGEMGKLRGRKPKLTPAREALLVDLHRTGQKNSSDLAELFGVGRSTVYRALERAAGRWVLCWRLRSGRPGHIALSEPS